MDLIILQNVIPHEFHPNAPMPYKRIFIAKCRLCVETLSFPAVILPSRSRAAEICHSGTYVNAHNLSPSTMLLFANHRTHLPSVNFVSYEDLSRGLVCAFPVIGFYIMVHDQYTRSPAMICIFFVCFIFWFMLRRPAGNVFGTRSAVYFVWSQESASCVPLFPLSLFPTSIIRTVSFPLVILSSFIFIFDLRLPFGKPIPNSLSICRGNIMIEKIFWLQYCWYFLCLY